MSAPMDSDQSTTAVPLCEYQRMKAHYIKRTERLMARAKRAEEALIKLIDQHHRTVAGSKLHAPERQDWPECPCRTCEAVRLLLPEQAVTALAGYRAERAVLDEQGEG